MKEFQLQRYAFGIKLQMKRRKITFNS